MYIFTEILHFINRCANIEWPKIGTPAILFSTASAVRKTCAKKCKNVSGSKRVIYQIGCGYEQNPTSEWAWGSFLSLQHYRISLYNQLGFSILIQKRFMGLQLLNLLPHSGGLNRESGCGPMGSVQSPGWVCSAVLVSPEQARARKILAFLDVGFIWLECLVKFRTNRPKKGEIIAQIVNIVWSRCLIWVDWQHVTKMTR